MQTHYQHQGLTAVASASGSMLTVLYQVCASWILKHNATHDHQAEVKINGLNWMFMCGDSINMISRKSLTGIKEIGIGVNTVKLT